MRRVSIHEFLAESYQGLLLDVRSPGEYEHAHIPGAISFPLFTNEERKVVGTAYKQQSRQAAIKIGLDYFGPKMRPMVEEAEKLAAGRWPVTKEHTNNGQQPTTTIFLYCWRGGMRSGAVAWLLNLYGFNVTVLSGGYKAFRNYVLKTFAQPYELNILGGYTGSGKTELLNELRRCGQPVIGLETLASHKGSAFGNLGMPPQPSQEMFENQLGCELLQIVSDKEPSPNTSIWIEDESQRIGHVNIPKAFWETMRRSPVYFLDIPFEARLQKIVSEYGQLDKDRLQDAIQRIGKRLGGLETKNALQLLQENRISDCFAILLHYYDRQYQKGLHNREDLPSTLTKICCEQTGTENIQPLLQAQQPSTHERIN